jgi:thymidylate kinase
VNARGAMILITGPDGVGKSTMISLLKAACKSEGIICLRGYVRSTIIPVRITKKTLIMVGRRDFAYTPTLHRLVVDADPAIISKLINLFILVDVIVLTFKIMLYKLLIALLSKICRRKVIILFERYTLDSAIDLINMKKDYKPSQKVFLAALSIFLRLGEDVDCIIMLDADLEVIIKRHIARMRDEFLDFITLQKALMPKLASMYLDKYHYIDTSKDTPLDTFIKIRNAISYCLNRASTYL